MVIVNVIKRFINTIPMQKTISQNDEIAMTYRFQIERHYNGLDLGLTDWEWSIAWNNSLDESNAFLIDYDNISVDEDFVYIDWSPRWSETASSGLFEFQIRAKRINSEGQLVKWHTLVARLDFNYSIGLGKVDRGILEDYLDKFMKLCSEATIEGEIQRAMAAELAISERIDNYEDYVENKFTLISNYLDGIAEDLENFDLKIIKNYVEDLEDKGEITSEDSLDEALAKLQYQIKHVSPEGILPVSKGGTGAESFEAGVLYSEGSTLPFKSTKGINGQILTIHDNKPTFRNVKVSELDESNVLLKFEKLSDTTIIIPE